MDTLGNINAEEGVTRCVCGCKYWENDHCASCGISVELSQIRGMGQVLQYAQEIWLNVQLTGLCARLGFDRPVHNLDVVTTTEKYRAKGWII